MKSKPGIREEVGDTATSHNAGMWNEEIRFMRTVKLGKRLGPLVERNLALFGNQIYHSSL